MGKGKGSLHKAKSLLKGRSPGFKKLPEAPNAVIYGANPTDPSVTNDPTTPTMVSTATTATPPSAATFGLSKPFSSTRTPATTVNSGHLNGGLGHDGQIYVPDGMYNTTTFGSPETLDTLNAFPESGPINEPYNGNGGALNGSADGSKSNTGDANSYIGDFGGNLGSSSGYGGNFGGNNGSFNSNARGFSTGGSSNRRATVSGESDSDFKQEEADEDDDWQACGKSSKSKTLNKSGDLRKFRLPRGSLRRWNENENTLALLGLVWACGEEGITLPFDMAAQVVDQTCTGGALQQALLKMRDRMNELGFQVPKLRMQWPTKPSTARVRKPRDFVKLPRRKPSHRHGEQSYIVTLKCAYRPRTDVDSGAGLDTLAQDAANASQWFMDNRYNSGTPQLDFPVLYGEEHSWGTGGDGMLHSPKINRNVQGAYKANRFSRMFGGVDDDFIRRHHVTPSVILPQTGDDEHAGRHGSSINNDNTDMSSLFNDMNAYNDVSGARDCLRQLSGNPSFGKNGMGATGLSLGGDNVDTFAAPIEQDFVGIGGQFGGSHTTIYPSPFLPSAANNQDGGGQFHGNNATLYPSPYLPTEVSNQNGGGQRGYLQPIYEEYEGTTVTNNQDDGDQHGYLQPIYEEYEGPIDTTNENGLRQHDSIGTVHKEWKGRKY